MKALKIAILDLNNGVFNMGIKCIKESIQHWQTKKNIDSQVKIFNVRQNKEVPDLNYDIYISSGGPGSPLPENDLEWGSVYFNWLEQLDKHNQQKYSDKKHAFFICHSFQLVTRYFKIGSLCPRKSTAFGIFPCHPISQNFSKEPVFINLPNPFYIIDSRDYQLLIKNPANTKTTYNCLALEKERPHINLPQAIMAIRFNPYFIGTQFHPEANVESMDFYLNNSDKKKLIITNHGLKKWQEMKHILYDEDKLNCTNKTILPNFFNLASENY